MPVTLISPLVLSAVLAAVASRQAAPSAQSQPTTAPVAAPVTPPADDAKPSPQDAMKARVDSFLGEIERAGATIATMSGKVAIETNDLFKETSEFRSGRLVVDGIGAKRRVALLLDETIVDGHVSQSIDHYIFGDGWYCRLDHKNRSFTRRRIATDGEDPLNSIGGQVPIPIGQKKADVLARFDVTEIQPPIDIPILGSMQNVAGLRLVPKAGTPMAEDTAALELFYDRVTIAPVGIVVRATVENPKYARWTAARVTQPVVNGEVKDSDRALLAVPEKAPEGWATVDETK
jgi:hypothetical protein